LERGSPKIGEPIVHIITARDGTVSFIRQGSTVCRAENDAGRYFASWKIKKENEKEFLSLCLI